MNQEYSIQEILKAVKELQSINKTTNKEINDAKNTELLKESDIPKDTLRLIEQAENIIKTDS